jgi:Asp-tRNA(Asn)/Glu-tRNA(Gln) amidotransferase A subunit family amidase
MSDANLDLCYMTATEAIAAFKNRTLSPVELLKAIIARCEQLQPKVNALTYTYFDRALEQAKAAEAQYIRRGGEPRPLEGVTVAIKGDCAVAVYRAVGQIGGRAVARNDPKRCCAVRDALDVPHVNLVGGDFARDGLCAA